MNIFILDKNHEKNVQSYVDKHVPKMILEHAQMMSTAVRDSGIDAGYKVAHLNHPCTKWVRESLDNWLWLLDLTTALHEEWQYRFNHTKVHKSYDMILSLPNPNIPSKGITPFAQAMPDQYKSSNAVKAYRAYYNGEKTHLHNWTGREIPEWIL